MKDMLISPSSGLGSHISVPHMCAHVRASDHTYLCRICVHMFGPRITHNCAAYVFSCSGLGSHISVPRMCSHVRASDHTYLCRICVLMLQPKLNRFGSEGQYGKFNQLCWTNSDGSRKDFDDTMSITSFDKSCWHEKLDEIVESIVPARIGNHSG